MTPKLKLHSNIAAPAGRAVQMCAKMLGIDLEFNTVVVLGAEEHLKQDYLKKNPQHTIPLLEEEDGFLLADSHAIMGYLVNQYAKNDSLYPKNPRQRAVVDHILHFDSSVLFIRGLAISTPLIFHRILPTEEKLKQLQDAFKILDAILEKNGTHYVAGDKLTIADFSITTTVTCFGILTPYADFPNVKAYIERMQQEPWYQLNEEGLNVNKTVVLGTWNELKKQ